MIKIFNKQKLKKENHKVIKDYTVLYKKFQRRLSSGKVDELLRSINIPYVNIFNDLMKKEIDKKYMENLYSNLSNSKIIKNKTLLRILSKNEVFGGNIFTSRNNYLILGDNELINDNNATLTPYHELFHLLTTRIDNKNTIRIGLQINDYGLGINEGYTELLTKRYFSKYSNNDYNAYPHFVWYMQMFEDIVGKEKLMDYYLNSKQEDFENDLIKLSSKNGVINLFNIIDELFINEEKLFDIQKKYLYLNEELDKDKMENYYEENKEKRMLIYEMISYLYQNKQIELLKEKKISKVDFEKNLLDFSSRNEKIKDKIENEEDLYRDYFKNDCVK